MRRLVRTRPHDLRVDFADADHVAYRGLIFRSGHYPKQQFTVTPADLAEVARTFEKTPVDLGHPGAASPLDGALGQLTGVELSPDGTALLGRVELPRWLDEKLGPAARKVSASFDRTTKRLRRLSLVTNPQIPDAELYAAFAAHSECQCHAKKEARAMPTRRQQMQDYLDSLGDEADLDLEAASLVLFPDAGDDPGDPGDDDDGGDGFDVIDAGGGSSDFAERRIADLEAENAAFAARLEQMERREVEAKAAEFATATIAAKKALPRERPRIERGYVQAATAERRLAAEFADGAGPSLLAEFTAAYEARRPNYLFDDAVHGGGTLPPGTRVLGRHDRDDAEFAAAAEDEDADAAYARKVNAKYLGRNRIAGNGHDAHQ